MLIDDEGPKDISNTPFKENKDNKRSEVSDGTGT
jgi:hypothetical protein